MALATSLAAAIFGSPRCTRAALAALVVLSLTAPARAVDQIYIWRDQSGMVRFSPVQEPEGRSDTCRIDPTTACEREAQPAVVVSDASRPVGY